MGYYDNYLAKQTAKGDFKIGDRVRILPQFKGKTYTAKQRRSGEWILQEFKTANWVLKRPDDYTGYHKQGLLAKSHMIEKVEKAEPKPSPTGMKPHDPPLQSIMPPAIHAYDAQFVEKFISEMPAQPPMIKQALAGSWATDDDLEQKDIITLRPGTVVLVKDPEHPDEYKGLWTAIEHSHTGLKWVAVAPLFGGVVHIARTEHITVVPQKDLTITYLPQ